MRVAEGLETVICVLSRLVGVDWGSLGSNLSVLASTQTFHPLFYTAVVGASSWVLHQTLQLLAMDASARTTMKGAAKCDKHCELQNSVNQ